MTLYIFIGPKKTGTSSVYTHLKERCDLEKFLLLPKESNILLKNVYTKDMMQKHVIDISPEYFSSYRAIFNVSMMPLDQDVKIIILSRDLNSKFISHLDYMIKKNEISDAILSSEFEKLFLQDNFLFFARIWQLLPHSVFIFELGSSAFVEFLETEFAVRGDLPRDNDGRFKTTSVFRIMKFFATVLRQCGLHKQVEKIGALRAVRRLAYSAKLDDLSGLPIFRDKVLDLRKLIKGDPNS